MNPRLAPLRAALGHRRLPLWAALVAVALTLPSLQVGWQLDDYPQRLIMLGQAPEVAGGPLAVFATIPGDRATNLRFMDRGILPWWSAPDLKLSFCRVLSAASLWLDYRLFPDSPALMHAESLLWFALLVVAIGLLYRRLLPPVTAGLAALLYAVDPGHAIPVAWLANRNAVLASLFGALALSAHDRWRRDGWRPGAAWSAVALALALLSGEMALGAAAFLAAYVCTVETGGLRRRILSFLPAGLTLGAWAVYYRLAGFGTRGSGMYLDPLASPVAFAAALLRRAPLLLLGQWTPVPADVQAVVPPEKLPAFVAAGWIVTAVLLFALLPLLRRDRTARFFALGAALALVPSAATTPSNRLLVWVGFGVLGLVAQLVAGVWEGADWRPRARAGRVLLAVGACAMILFHLLLAPLLLPFFTLSVRSLGGPVARAAATVPGGLAGRDVVVVNAPEYLLYVSFIPSHLPLAAKPEKPLPRSFRGLTAGPFPVAVTRLDERTLAVHLEGDLFGGLLGRLMRTADRPLAPGWEVELRGLAVQVAAVSPDGEPRQVVFRFAQPLEDPALVWLQWQGEGFAPWTPPAVGQTVTLPAPPNAFNLTRRRS